MDSLSGKLLSRTLSPALVGGVKIGVSACLLKACNGVAGLDTAIRVPDTRMAAFVSTPSTDSNLFTTGYKTLIL